MPKKKSKKNVLGKVSSANRRVSLTKNYIGTTASEKKKVYNWVCLECGVSDEASLNPRCPVCGLRMDAGRVIKW